MDKEYLITSLSNIAGQHGVSISKELLGEIVSISSFRVVNKGEVIRNVTEKNTTAALVLAGMCRAFYVDEDGNDIELEYVDALEHNGQIYMAFFPTVEDGADESDAEDYGLVILKTVTENGEEFLSTLDSDEEVNEIYDLFMEQILEDEDENS